MKNLIRLCKWNTERKDQFSSFVSFKIDATCTRPTTPKKTIETTNRWHVLHVHRFSIYPHTRYIHRNGYISRINSTMIRQSLKIYVPISNCHSTNQWQRWKAYFIIYTLFFIERWSMFTSLWTVCIIKAYKTMIIVTSSVALVHTSLYLIYISLQWSHHCFSNEKKR